MIEWFERSVWSLSWLVVSAAPVEVRVETQQPPEFRDHGDEMRGVTEFRASHRLVDISTTAEASIHIVVTVETVGDYDIAVSSTLAGERLDEAVVTDECNGCLKDEFLTHIDAAIDRQLEALRAAESAETTQVSETNIEPSSSPPVNGSENVPPTTLDSAPVSPTVSTEHLTSSSSKAPPLRLEGKIGIPLLSVGVVGLGIGTGLAIAGRRLDEESHLYATDYRLPGYITLAISGASVVAGLVLLGFDRTRAKKNHRAILPTLGPRSASVMAVGRF